ncbi:hypothetical protein POM88_020267 [Heracleum sosnowskyi]|uniref:Ubiquitin-like protease family profile domain-containing protein n=1 Tax=Heracleum sosnowskyi TaxID=360622 RepID=A0AAD8MRQ2_9APIA|nr:hypothetical protein POM88_020267 [Heracleum sosnowskyi]
MSQYSESPSTVSNILKWLAYGPDIPVISYQGYDVNGYTFYTQCQDDKSTVQNSGVSVKASTTEFERGNSITSRDIKKSYYGVIEEIWELDYKDFKVALFKWGLRNNRKEFLWNHTEVQCPQQEGGTECGFYVMRYMHDIVMLSQKNPNVNWKVGLALGQIFYSRMLMIRCVCHGSQNG